MRRIFSTSPTCASSTRFPWPRDAHMPMFSGVFQNRRNGLFGSENRDSSRRLLRDAEAAAIGSRLEVFTDEMLGEMLRDCSPKLQLPHPPTGALLFAASWGAGLGRN